MSITSFNCVQVDETALIGNYRRIREQAGVTVMAMVKADAYGHGMVESARAFARAGCSCFGVAELGEGVLLRQAGLTGDIFVTIGFAPADAGNFFKYQLTPVIYDYSAAEVLAGQAVALNRTIGVHVKVDTGMGRLGILPDELPALLLSLRGLSGIEVTGVMSHFPEADDPRAASTGRALASFITASSACGPPGSTIRHIANSAGVLNHPDARCDLVRCGIALYGYHPAGASGRSASMLLQPAMSFSSRILQVKVLPAGAGVSYGHTYRTTRPTTLAVLPVGYEDGYSRALSNRAEVLIHGRRVPVRGRICMNMSMVDVTGITGVKAGDEAVLLGRQGEEVVDADELAEKGGTISYEVLCLLGNNNHRVYRQS
jgi:alanine racemase